MPVVIVTARDSVGDRIAGLDAGADDYLVKPFDLDELLARARAVVRRKSGRSTPDIACGALTIDPVAERQLGLAAVAHPVHRVPGVLQAGDHGAPDHGVVFDDEDSHAFPLKPASLCGDVH